MHVEDAGRTGRAHGGSRVVAVFVASALAAAMTMLAGCDNPPPPLTSENGGRLAGQVVISGPVRGAKVSVAQLDFGEHAELTVRTHLGDTETDAEGRFSVDVLTYSGLLLVTVQGGSFVDLATGATIQLDPSVGLESIEPLDLIEQRDDALVSPIGHLIATRTRALMSEHRQIEKASLEAQEHLHRHFGNVPWTRVKLAPLDEPATSPTEPVRAAFIHAALSFLADDIARAANTSPQEVNVLTLTHQLAADIRDGRFDGNDNDSLTPGMGLQVGVCEPDPGCSAPPTAGCTLGACRPLCDLYSGTVRTLLAGEVTKVIQSQINQTGLTTGDVLAVARAMSENADEELFGPSACIENLDRLPPRLDWAPPTPDEGAYVRASFRIKAVVSDDTDARPQVTVESFPNEPADRAVSATVDSAAMPDGTLVLTAKARDMAGNGRTIQRTVRVDNTPPTLTLDPAGYLVDGDTWWTAEPQPTLTGTVGDAAPVTVGLGTAAGMAGATVTGDGWSGSVPGMLSLVGADVTVAATDAAGNRVQLTQRIRADVTPPELTFQASVVNDEATELPTFDANAAPVHVHNGTAVDLASGAGCPAVTKFSYLLGASLPPYGTEVTAQGAPRRNPLHYVLLATDNGVGVASTQYRVGHRAGGSTTWLLDWSPAPAPTRISAGVDQYDVGIFSDHIPQLATTEGTYDVELRATDRLGRVTTVARCFELRLRAPPLQLQAPGAVGNPVPIEHRFRLESLVLAPPVPPRPPAAPPPPTFTQIAARLLNDNSTGASVIDEDVTNGTASTIYLDVGVTKPRTVFAGQSFRLANVVEQRSASFDCTDDPELPPPALCRPPAQVTYTSASPGDNPDASPSFFVKLFELDGSLAPAAELPCTVCGVGGHWKFAIPPRSGRADAPAPPRRFKVMTMIGQLAQLWPSDTSFPAFPPFQDTSLNGLAFTGIVSAAREGCTSHTRRELPDGTVLDTCTRVSRITSYRALTVVQFRFAGILAADYKTAATPVLAPTGTTRRQFDDFAWGRAAGSLP